jgi:hypothetical protein
VGSILSAALLTSVALYVGGDAAAQQPACDRFEAAFDRQGLRVRDQAGQWRYVTIAESIQWVELVRFPSGIAPEWGMELHRERLAALFGGCAAAYAPLLSPFLGPGVHLAQRGPDGALLPGQAVAVASRAFAYRGTLYTTGGSDLLDLGALYAVADDGSAICGLTVPESAKDLFCTAEARGRITGIVRMIAETFREHGVTATSSPAHYYFKDGKLRVVYQTTSAAGPRELRFEEP